MNRWMKMLLFAVIGGLLGFAYYYFIGCTSGSCALTSNPYITSGYGIGAGLLIGWDGKFSSKKKEENNTNE